MRLRAQVRVPNKALSLSFACMYTRISYAYTRMRLRAQVRVPNKALSLSLFLSLSLSLFLSLHLFGSLPTAEDMQEAI